MKATKLTPKIKEWIRTEFGSYCYDNSHSEYFHYPNYKDNKGFKDGFHTSTEVEPDYTELSEQEFLNEFAKWEPKRGEMVFAWDNDESMGGEEIFVNYTEGSMFPYITVSSGDEEKFKNNEPFNTIQWKKCKRIEVEEITIEEAEKRFNVKIKKQ